MERKDFVVYSDTDSLFVDLGGFLDKEIGEDWKKLPDEKIIFYIKKLTKVLENYVDEHCYRDVQRKIYNSAVQDFRIKWKQEIIAKSALFISKKHYASWHVDEEGVPVDKIKSTGLEIVRSETPAIVKPRLKEIVEMILRNVSDNDIRKTIQRHKKEINGVSPEEIAINIGVNEIDKYLTEDNSFVKGAPMHVKGVINYRKLLSYLDLTDKYEDINIGTKTKVVYVKKNILGLESVSFIRWPVEFDNIVQIDYSKMIDKFYISKVEGLLEPMAKENLLHDNIAGLDLFFI